ncbi:CocE/NonD family hydrolase [Nocardia sp. NPDC048505]|uniref:CocE/NonD family hydrolase n=1 Tax=Nocardia sp. NPDC048505 TaxID=3155756 RepID=UPI0034035FE6
MSDGTVLYADIAHPGDQAGPTADPRPAVITFTVYNKWLVELAESRVVRALGRAAGRLGAGESAGLGRLLRTLAGGTPDAAAANHTLVSRGYVYVLVDVRGTGASTGEWKFLGIDEQRDYLEVIDWVRHQHWCRGDFALAGISYHAMAALTAAGLRPAGLKAVFAIEGAENADREIAYAGGVPSPFTLAWTSVITAAKFLPPLPVLLRDSTLTGFLRDRLSAPLAWLDRVVPVYLRGDDPDLYRNEKWAERWPDLEAIEVPTFLVGGWHDIFNHSPLRLYTRLDLPPGRKQVLVEDSYHFTPGSALGAPGNPPGLDELQCAWFNRWVENESNGIEHYGPIVLGQLNGEWIARAEFPPPQAQPVRFYLTGDIGGSAAHSGYDGALSTAAPPVGRSITLRDNGFHLTSDNAAIATGGLITAFGRATVDQRGEEKSAATFTTVPFAARTIISGPMCLHLVVDTTGHDALWVATVSRVDSAGASSGLAHGALRSSLRALDTDDSRYADGELIEPRHPLTAESVQEVRPGEPHELDIALNAVEAVLDAGDRLRVAVRRASFPRHVVPPGLRRIRGTQRILLDPARPSHLTLCLYRPQS